MKGAERIYVYPEFTHSCTERGKGDVEYIRADIVEEMIEQVHCDYMNSRVLEEG
jgi:hypothetical protein